MRSGMKARSAADISPNAVMRGAGIRDRQSGVADTAEISSMLKGSIIIEFYIIFQFSPLLYLPYPIRNIRFYHCGC